MSARWDVVREAGPPAVCAAGVVCGLTWLAWTGLGRAADSLALAAVVAVAVLVVVGAVRLGRSVALSYPIGGHGHSAAHAAKHGHRRVAEALGCRVRVHLGDRPRTEILSGPPLTMAELAAIAYGGEVAAGRAGCDQDRAIARAHLSQLPRAERAAAEQQAWRIARRYAR